MNQWGLLPGDFDDKEDSYTLTGTVQQITKADSTRFAIVIGATSGTPNQFAGVSSKPGMTAGQGLSIPPNGASQVFTFRDFGAWVQKALYINGSSGPTVTVVQIFYRPPAGDGAVEG